MTCKIRRVKCDETKPACDRCTSTGRKCDGYIVPPPKKPSYKTITEIALVRGIDPVLGSRNELRALDFFRTRTAPGLSSYFDAEFWTRLVLQMSHAEPAIKHAMVAVGTLHEKREDSVQTVPKIRSVVMTDPMAISVPVTKARDDSDPFALAQYNKAIQHLSKRLNDPDTSSEIALLACILFVCVEFLRGDVEPAMRHFQSGMAIAMAYSKKTGGSQLRYQMDLVKENMLPFFHRLELLSTLFGNDAMWQYPIDLEQVVPTEFNNLKEARDSVVSQHYRSILENRYQS